MIRVLGPPDFVVQPWANGRGQTVELARHDGPQGMVWRISVATVAEDGPFSRFPGIGRSLTVIDGRGFRISGDGVDVRAEPLVPVSFPGGAAVAASEVVGISRDFNVMLAGTAPMVRVASGAAEVGGAVYALAPLTAAGQAVAAGALVLADGRVRIDGALWIAADVPVQG